ncbi:unnamed protein product [Moneuplotes crassus]|uniref:Protoporphyrinogen oxidase n=1 Tax=Euplotes crassus TaxID=5936 RepID=A0AAD1X4R9_EUPCR|nr:unnamed protein product [Moneuplotes crassus]
MKETTIERVNERENSFDIHYKPEGAKRQKTRGFDFVISALPANHLKHILADSHFKTSKHKEIVDTLSSINYIDMATLNLSYLQHIDISGKCHGHVLTPSGYLQESQGVLGVLAMHKSFRQNGLYQNKKTFDFDIDVRHPFRSRINFFRHVAINGWSSRVDPPFEDAPESDKLRRDKMANFAVMLGGAHFPEACHLPDDELVRRSEEFLEKTYGITQGADYISLKKNFECIPQYNTGHIQKMHDIVQTMNTELPRFRLTGNYIDGSGIPHIVNYAKREVERVAQLSRQKA